jgi:hypothetical protein
MSDSPKHLSEEFNELLSVFIDDKITEEQSNRLAEIIESDPDARTAYLDQCRMHATLAWEHGVLGGMSFPEDNSETIIEVPGLPFRSKWKRPLAIAASLTLFASIIWTSVIPAVQEHNWKSGEVVGKVSRKSGGHLKVANLDITLTQGDTLRIGEYELTEGLAQLNLENKVRVVLEAPVRFNLKSTKLIELHNGKLSAHVSPEGLGFIVETPNAQVVDFGTEFGVEVDSENQCEVHVFEGVVEVKSFDSVEEPVRLFTDQATRVDTFAGEPQGIVIAPERFVRSFEEPIRPYSTEVRLLDPALYYRMKISDDALTLEDKSGNNAHGQLVRGPNTKCVYGTGKIGACIRLNGPKGETYAVVPNYPKAQDNQLSVVAWVKADSRPRWATVAKNWNGNEIGQFRLGLFHDQGGLEAQIREASGEVVQVKDSEPFALGEWQHVAMVADGQYLRLYRNGVEIDRKPYSTITAPTIQRLTIGARLLPDIKKQTISPGAFWDGRIDELAIFNHGLTQENIQRLFAAAVRVETYAGK